MMTGTALAAWLVTSPSDTLWWTLAPAMFLAGIGGGGVISPNFTLTLAEVPPRMGGAAGGALQTGQRIGSALGAALLMTVYQAAQSFTSVEVAARWSLVAALAVLADRARGRRTVVAVGRLTLRPAPSPFRAPPRPARGSWGRSGRWIGRIADQLVPNYPASAAAQ